MKWQRKVFWIAAGTLAGLVVWVSAPIDLVPRWLAMGSYDRGERSTIAPRAVPVIALPDGFVRDLVGLRLEDAKLQAQAHGLAVWSSDIWFGGSGWTVKVDINAVSLGTFLGRVVEAERPATTGLPGD